MMNRGVFIVLMLCGFCIADPNTVTIPFIGQWCNQDTSNTIYPSVLEVNKNGIDWAFHDDQWTPALAEGFLKVYPEAYVGTADVEVQHNGNTKKIRFQGIFKITVMQAQSNVCDLTGDNKIDLKDYAKWAAGWLKPDAAILPMVWVSQTGTKYHLKTCRYWNESYHAMPLLDAMVEGCTPCSVCKPLESLGGE